MSDVKRYLWIGQPAEDPQGTLVSFADYAALRAQLATVTAELELQHSRNLGMTVVIDSKDQQLAQVTAYLDEKLALIVRLTQQLATVTAERENYKAKWLKEAALTDVYLLKEIAERDVTIADLKARWHAATTHDADLDYVEENRKLRTRVIELEAALNYIG